MVFGLVRSVLFGHVSAQNIPAQNPRVTKSKGWGYAYDWMDLTEGVDEAKRERKPIMLIIHSMRCQDCIQLKRKFAKDPTIQNLQNNFVMINLEAKDIPNNDTFAPDGDYTPRILFFTPDGSLLKDANNEFLKETKYMYSNPAFMTDSMKKVARRFGLL